MSLLPSPLKSPRPAIDQLASGATARPLMVSAELATMADPFICHSTSAPPAPCQSTSARPSLLKSLMPATLHDASGATRLPFDVTAPPDTEDPVMLQSASEPS